MSAAEPFLSTEYAFLFFDLFEVSSDPVLIIRVDDGVILEANDSLLSLVGRTRPRVIGQSVLDLWVRPDDRAAYVAELRAKGRVKAYPARMRTRAGEEFAVHLSARLASLRGETVALTIMTLARQPAHPRLSSSAART